MDPFSKLLTIERIKNGDYWNFNSYGLLNIVYFGLPLIVHLLDRLLLTNQGFVFSFFNDWHR